MTQPRTFKTCPHCFEEIDARASFCPRCRSAQSYGRTWLRRHWILAIILGIVVFNVAMLPYAFLMEYVFKAPFSRDNAAYFHGEVKVASSKMLFGLSKDGPVVCVIGMLRNDSDVAWRGLELEVHYYNHAGELIDVGSAVRDYYVTAILPHGEVAYKVRGLADRPISEYASCKVFVRSAVDARRFP